jgi:DNA-binding MarR family transcriptional regulator
MTMSYYLLSKYIASIYRYSKNQFNRQLEQSKLGATQIDVLLFIQEHPDDSQAQIANDMFLDASLLSRDIRYLVKMGYVQRQRTSWDLRQHTINLTPSGQKIAIAVKRVMAAWWEDFFVAHSAIDPEQFETQLATAYQSLNDELDPAKQENKAIRTEENKHDKES